MKYSVKLREHLVKSFGLAENAGDDQVGSFVTEKILSGELSADKVKELNASEAESKISEIVNKEVGGRLSVLEKNLEKMTELLTKAVAQPASKEVESAPAPGAIGQKILAGASAAGASGGDSDRIRVKSVAERYNDTRTALTWQESKVEHIKSAFGHRQVELFSGTPEAIRFDKPTDLQKAIAGAWFKKKANAAYMAAHLPIPHGFKMTEEDRQLCEYAVHECKFTGPINYEGGDRAEAWYSNKGLNEVHRKALLDDATSGGLEAVPIEFDSMLILTPLLEGELFPLVDVIPVGRRRIEAAAMANPTVSWGVAEGTAITPFTTTSMVTAFDNTIWPMTGAIEVGNDFLADSPLNIGGQIVGAYGRAFRKELDDVIAYGNGTSQPTGVFTTSGLTTVSSAGGAGTDPQVGDYESLMKSVPKEFRQEAGPRAVYLANDTSYFRARGIAVGASDQRRVFGMDHKNYTIFDTPYKVNGDIVNARIAFVCLNRYRLYRRSGLEVVIDSTGKTNRLANQTLIVIRARFGGNLDHASAAAKITDAKA